jgi:hypothetical protein
MCGRVITNKLTRPEDLQNLYHPMKTLSCAQGLLNQRIVIQAWWRQMARHVERKAISLQIHNLAQKNILHRLHLFSVVSLHGVALVGPLCGEWGIPSTIPDNLFLDCIIVTHKVYTYAGLFIRLILIGRATDFHIENVFRVN